MAYEHSGPAKHRTEMARSKFCTLKAHLPTRSVLLKYRLQLLRTEIRSVLLGSHRHMTADTLSVVESTIIRTTRICMRLSRPDNEDWVAWQERS